MREKPINNPGPKPAMNRDEIDVFVATPYTTIGMDGGIMTPILPAHAINANVNRFEYPFSSIVGTTIEPTAATVAGPEPETAAKNIHTTTVQIASPPVILPKNALQTFKRRFETPPLPISSPARINRGIAIRGNESDAVTSVAAINVLVRVPRVRTAARDAHPIAIPTGTFSIKNIIKPINNAAVTILFLLC